MLLPNVPLPEVPSMSPELSLPEIMARLRQGDADAARLIFERFAQRLIGLARSHLDRSLRGKVDPEDVMQSVFKSFFRIQREETVALSEWNDLWSLLAVITLRKCGHRAAYYQAACRDVRRESTSSANDDEAEAGWEVIAREPTPLEAMMLGETVEEILRSLDERERLLASLALQGYTRMEIAERVGCTERTVYRVLERLRRHLERSTDGTT
jgi:RNA polymerase sigma-70 factor (ECF subfamily)